MALAACLVPYAGVDTQQLSSDSADVSIPSAPNGTAPGPAGGLAGYNQLPADVFTARATPDAVACNAPPTELVHDSGLSRDSVNPLTTAATTNGYTVAQDGSKAVVSGQLSVDQVSADVLIGDTP